MMLVPTTVYAVTAMETVAVITESELLLAPKRLALWRLGILDGFLRQIEELRLSRERLVPEDLGREIAAFAGGNDPVLAARMVSCTSSDTNWVHDAIFDAQERVMAQLADMQKRQIARRWRITSPRRWSVHA